MAWANPCQSRQLGLVSSMPPRNIDYSVSIYCIHATNRQPCTDTCNYHLRLVLIHMVTTHGLHSVLPHNSISATETEKPLH